MRITAKFPGECARCGRAFAAGDTIRWSPETRLARCVRRCAVAPGSLIAEEEKFWRHATAVAGILRGTLRSEATHRETSQTRARFSRRPGDDRH